MIFGPQRRQGGPPIQPGIAGPCVSHGGNLGAALASILQPAPPAPAPLVPGLLSGNNHGTGRMPMWTTINGPSGGLF